MIATYFHGLKAIPDLDKNDARALVAHILMSESFDNPATITVCLVTDKFIRRLNKQFHGRDTATDVLAFSLGDKDKLVADVFVSVDTARRQAKSYKNSLKEELYLYIIHGILHVLGYDDHSAQDRKVMRRKERGYLGKWL